MVSEKMMIGAAFCAFAIALAAIFLSTASAEPTLVYGVVATTQAPTIGASPLEETVALVHIPVASQG